MIRDLLIAAGVVILTFVLLSILFSPTEGIRSFENTRGSLVKNPELSSTIYSNTATINLPAVDNQGNGVIAKLKVQAIPGEGRVLTNIDNLLFWVDTQFSIKVAEMVAENITGKDLSNIDLIYTVETEASVIEGQSAGAALTIATIAVIENKTLNPDAMITGTINPDGTIGPVGAIFAKAKASKDLGAKTFLVPSGQGMQVNYIPEKTCEQLGSLVFCRTEYKAEKVDVSKDIGVEVKEVRTIREALGYFIS